MQLFSRVVAARLVSMINLITIIENLLSFEAEKVIK